jgi:creatinine amidohydrolase
MTRSLLAAAFAAVLTATVSAQVVAQSTGVDQQPGDLTMLEMTSPEFAAAVATTDVMLLPIGAIEEHGPHLPLDSDTIGALGQVHSVQRYLRGHGVETIIGPALDIGITNEAGDWTRDGTYMYPGSLTLPAETFVRLYVDLLRSLRANGVRVVFLCNGHLGGRHLTAVARVASEAAATIEGLRAYALIDSERLETLPLAPSATVLPIDHGLNFEMLTRLLGAGTEPARSTHADGWETSLMLHYRPELVRPGYAQLPQAPTSRFLAAVLSGDASKNPGGMGGFPFDRASAAVGQTIDAYRSERIATAILAVLSAPARAEPAGSGSGQPVGEEGRVRQTVQAFYAAFNAHGFDQAAQFTTDDWAHINPFGGWTRGRDAVLAELREVHGSFLKGVTDTPDSIAVRFASPEAAVVTVPSQMSRFVTPDGTVHENERQIRTFVVVKRSDRWLIMQDQNTVQR